MLRRGFKLGLLCSLLVLAGCETIGFYRQAVVGQLGLLSQRSSLEEALRSPDLSPQQKRDLARLQRVKAFAENQLQLPLGGAYSSFVQLPEPYVVWNVFAAPAYSLEPKRWCYPVAGCASYRGYFAEDEARAYAARLREQGYDVVVSGVRAYSTLGWFDDPVLSSFLDYSPTRQAGLIFHELAHKQLYVAGDTEFNESFATAVEQAGLALWLSHNDAQAVLQAVQARHAARQHFLDLVASLRQQLEAAYALSTAAAKQDAKRAAFADFRSAIRDWGEPGYQRWDNERLNNADLVPLQAYSRWVCALHTLYQQQGGFSAFYQAAQALAELDASARETALQQLHEEGRCEL